MIPAVPPVVRRGLAPGPPPRLLARLFLVTCPRGSFRASPRTLPAATLSALGATVLSEGHVKSLFTTRSKVERK